METKILSCMTTTIAIHVAITVTMPSFCYAFKMHALYSLSHVYS